MGVWISLVLIAAPWRFFSPTPAPTGLLNGLNGVPVSLLIAVLLEGGVLMHGVDEVLLVDLGDVEALVLEELDELGLMGLDLLGGARGGFLGDLDEDLAILVGELGPEA